MPEIKDIAVNKSIKTIDRFDINGEIYNLVKQDSGKPERGTSFNDYLQESVGKEFKCYANSIADFKLYFSISSPEEFYAYEALKIDNSGVASNVGFKRVDLYKVNQLETMAVARILPHGIVIIRTSEVCTAIADTPIVGDLSTLKIYVPKNLVEAYKTAPNWTEYANCFRAIEDYPEITAPK